MGHLNTLALTALKARVAMTPNEARRQKLITKLQEQLALAEAEAAGSKHVVMKQAWTRDRMGLVVPNDAEEWIPLPERRSVLANTTAVP